PCAPRGAGSVSLGRQPPLSALAKERSLFATTKVERDRQGRCTMCRIFATQDPASYALATRALRLNGHTTSIRLETAYWQILDEIAAAQGLTTPRLIGKLYEEVLDWR